MSAPLAQIKAALSHRNVQAFLRALRLGEGTSDEDGYRRIVGGQLFDDFSRHPKVYVSIYIRKLGMSVRSSAAGAYQFIWPTWSTLQHRYKLPDFSPESQDIAAVGLIAEVGALSDVIAGRFFVAVEKCSSKWASLPGSKAGQRIEPLARVRAEYEKWGGAVAA